VEEDVEEEEEDEDEEEEGQLPDPASPLM